MTNPALWLKLSKFGVGTGHEQLTFTDRLARENGWGEETSEQVFGEYMRFVYLAMVSSRPVTPSEMVDQAWHLHLCYSQSYWQDMCANILPRPLHHGPTRGGATEDQRYWDQYEATLECYAEEFGEAPPPDIWPSAEMRFRDAAGWVRVNRREVWVLPKKPVRLAAMAGGFAALLVGCKSMWDENERTGVLILAAFFVVFLGFCFSTVVQGLTRRRRKRSRRGRRNDGAGCGTGDSGGGGCGSGCGSGGCGGGGCGS